MDVTGPDLMDLEYKIAYSIKPKGPVKGGVELPFPHPARF